MQWTALYATIDILQLSMDLQGWRVTRFFLQCEPQMRCPGPSHLATGDIADGNRPDLGHNYHEHIDPGS
jgi:hypothetical protein